MRSIPLLFPAVQLTVYSEQTDKRNKPDTPPDILQHFIGKKGEILFEKYSHNMFINNDLCVLDYRF